MERVLVTGATGFIGAQTLRALQAGGFAVRATWHRRPPPAAPGVDWRQHDLGAPAGSAGDLVAGVDTVLHLGARAHVTGPGRFRSSPFDRVNVQGTRHLAVAARRAGVRRFIYLGSAGVHGNESAVVDGVPRPLRADDPFHPADAYARSKLAGETALVEACAGGAMQHVILRVPLVFGAGVGGNFLKLMRHVDRGWPLPVASRAAPRTLAGVDNLAAALVTCIRSPGVAGRAFLVGDYDITVPDLARRLARLLGRPLRTLQVPDCLLHGRALRSVTTPLLVDSALFRAVAGWQPQLELDAALECTVCWYRTLA